MWAREWKSELLFFLGQRVKRVSRIAKTRGKRSNKLNLLLHFMQNKKKHQQNHKIIVRFTNLLFWVWKIWMHFCVSIYFCLKRHHISFINSHNYCTAVFVSFVCGVNICGFILVISWYFCFFFFLILWFDTWFCLSVTAYARKIMEATLNPINQFQNSHNLPAKILNNQSAMGIYCFSNKFHSKVKPILLS